MPDETTSPEKHSRKWRVPPAVRSNRESLSGEKILAEVEGDVGLLLWQSARDVELWADAEAEQRPRLFQAGAFEEFIKRLAHPATPSVVKTQLRIIAGATRADSTTAAQLAGACLAISAWATQEGHSWTAVAFAQAGALALPENAEAAYTVGRAARRAADYSKAESWYQRAVALARRSADWETYALANVGIGNAYFKRGAIPMARKALLRALRAARKYRLWTVRGLALHDLFCIAANGSHFAEAERLARLAFKAYGKRHPRLPALAHDVAQAWVLQGHFERAIPVLQALATHALERPLRLLYLSSLARAAASAGERAIFLTCWIEAFSLIQAHQNMEHAADSLINLAHGAATLDDTERTEVAAHYALAIATHRREAHARLMAENVLDSVSQASVAAIADHVKAKEDEVEHSELSSKFIAALAISSRPS